jgi:hypothetical protein
MATMVLNTYAGLQAAVATFLARTDLTEQIPGFIQLVEAQITRVLRRTTVRASVTISGASYTLPANVAELRSLRLVTTSTGSDVPIKIVTPEQLTESRAARSVVGRPSLAAVVGSTLLLVPACDQAYTMEMTYFDRLIPLSAANASNVVLAEAPDLYLFGALKEAAPFLEHDERTPLWESKYNTALAQLEAVREREEFGASLRPSRLPVRW